MYGTLAGWRAYATERGDTAPSTATDADALASLVRASDHIQYRYVAHLLPGYDETLPIIVPATYVAASLELATPGFWTKVYTPSEQKVLTEVKGIKWTVTGSASKAFGSAPISTLIEAMFQPFVTDIDRPSIFLRSIGGGDACG